MSDRGNEESFREAGYAHEQRVASGKEADRELFDHLLLTNDHLADFLAQGLVDFSQFVDGGDIIFGELRGEVGVKFHDRDKVQS